MRTSLFAVGLLALLALSIIPLCSAEEPGGHRTTRSPTSMDTDGNGIDDVIDEYASDPAGSKIGEFVASGYLQDDEIPVFIDYSMHPGLDDRKALQDLGASIQIRLVSKYLDVIVAQNLTARQVQLASRLPGVTLVEFQGIYLPVLDISVEAVKARASTEYSPYTAQEYQGGFKGEGVVIAILDTGVDDEHDGLQGKFVAGVDFQDSSDDKDGTNNPDDKDGHGTHCAGTAMGTGGTQGTYQGVAPEAKLVDLKVLSNWGIGGNLYEGIEWCIQNKETFGIDVLSISAGELGGGSGDGSDANARIAQQAVDNGLIIAAAIGNEGNDHVGISSPASADNVIAVGAVDDAATVDREDDSIADFSNSGPRADDGDGDVLDELKPDVVAPGVDIHSTASYNGNLKVVKAAGYQDMSGTSMACPHVAGICALIHEANPDLTPQQIQEILRQSSESRGEAYNPDHGNYSSLFGWGMVDAYNAVKMATGDFQKVNIDLPAEGAYVSGTVEVKGTATNQRGFISQVEVKVDDGTWMTADGTTDWSFSWNTPTTNGPHTLYIRSQNNNGENSDEFVRHVNVNNLMLAFTSPYDSQYLSGKIEITGTCEGFHIEYVEISIDGGGYSLTLNTASEGAWTAWKYTWETKNEDDGPHTLCIRAKSAGNEFEGPQITVYVDNGTGDDTDDTPGFELGSIMFLILVLGVGTGAIRRRSY